jgi:hypothetical protein
MKAAKVLILIAGAASALFAQEWEIGGSAGASYTPGVHISNPAGSATAGLQTGFLLGGYLGQNLYRNLSGEIRYGFSTGALRLASNGAETSFSSVSHRVHYDLLLHTSRSAARAQYFLALGGGIRVFRGTGAEAAYQPLSQFAYLTKTQTVKPMASVGAGVRFQLSTRVFLRMEFRDYISSFPEELITPAPGSKVGSLLHDLVPMLEISYQIPKKER